MDTLGVVAFFLVVCVALTAVSVHKVNEGYDLSSPFPHHSHITKNTTAHTSLLTHQLVTLTPLTTHMPRSAHATLTQHYARSTHAAPQHPRSTHAALTQHSRNTHAASHSAHYCIQACWSLLAWRCAHNNNNNKTITTTTTITTTITITTIKLQP